MGNWFGKREDNTPNMAGEQRPTKHVSLLVLHNRSAPPNMEKFRRALNAYPPPSSIAVDNSIKKMEISEATNHQDVTQWVDGRLNQNRVVLICLLCDYNIQFLSNRNSRVIPFCFQNPKVTCPNCVKVDFDTATQQQIKSNLDSLAALIKGIGH